jgi:hypothetical protein
MSWFRHVPHRRDTAKTRPHPADDQLPREIEQNRERLAQHREQQTKDTQDGKLH